MGDGCRGCLCAHKPIGKLAPQQKVSVGKSRIERRTFRKQNEQQRGTGDKRDDPRDVPGAEASNDGVKSRYQKIRPPREQNDDYELS